MTLKELQGILISSASSAASGFIEFWKPTAMGYLSSLRRTTSFCVMSPIPLSTMHRLALSLFISPISFSSASRRHTVPAFASIVMGIIFVSSFSAIVMGAFLFLVFDRLCCSAAFLASFIEWYVLNIPPALGGESKPWISIGLEKVAFLMDSPLSFSILRILVIMPSATM